MIYLCLFILLFCLSIILIDLIPQFWTWQSRIKIGQFENQKDWEKKVFSLSRRWLKNTPTIKLTDQTRLIFIDVIKGNYTRSTIQAWQEAALVLGLTEYHKKNTHQVIQQEIVHFFNKKTLGTGAWKIKPTATDEAILAYALLNADFINKEKYKPALDETYQMILSLKGKDGTVSYKSHTRDFRFVDTIGFICPFLTLYGLQFNHPDAINLAIHQIKEYVKHGMMPNRNIPCHTYQVETKIPTGLFGWGRGLGWFVIGLADTWKLLPSYHPEKEHLKQIMIKTVHSVVEFQQENGGFHWLLFDTRSRMDSSTTATLAWFFRVAEEISEVSEICVSAKEKCLQYLLKVTRRNGAVDFSQGDTKGIGIYSQNFDILPFTQGFLLRTLYN